MKSFIATTLFLGCVGRLVHAQVSAWGQCGGQDWTGGTTCVSGYVCTYSNSWYSQCIPGTAGATTTSKAPTTTTSTAPTSTASSKGTFTNPIKKSNGSDPYIVYSNGYYYLTTTTWSNIQITRATTINGLKTATPKVIWTDTATDRCCSMWAPEIHWISGEGRWFIYYTAGPAGGASVHLHVAKSSGTDIWSSTWSYAGRIVIPNHDTVSSLDPSVFSYNGAYYLLFSSNSATSGYAQSIYIAKMNSPTTIGNAVVISVPTNSWETVGAPVNEGPVALINNGRVWVFFSASLCSGTGYKLGRLELVGSDLLNASSWQKYSNPVLLGANGNNEPGHNGFFSGPSGNAYIVYHASAASPGTCDGSRYTMVQPLSWDSSGRPVLPDRKSVV